MPAYINVFNVSLEKWRIQFDSKGYTFEPRKLTKLPENLEPFVIEQYARKGLIVVRPGDDLKAKEFEGLNAYLAFLYERKSWFHMYIDEKKRGGVTIEPSRDYQMICQWITEIETRLKKEGVFKPIPSFDNFKIADKSIFEGEMQVMEIKELSPEARKRGRPAKSFTEVSIEEEIG